MKLRRIAVLGANGQVGRALAAQLGERAIPLTRAEADLAHPEKLAAILDLHDPDAVINAAAYTAVDKAEEEPKLAHTINADAPQVLAAWCAAKGKPFVHYSTDYVFDGSGEHPWVETDPTAPLNEYGRSKRAGEVAVEEAGGEHLIFRTSWVYDAHGKNFLNTMLRVGAEREELKVVADQHGAPCYAPHLAEASIAALDAAHGMEAFHSGIYHMANAGEVTWHGFAEAIFAEARKAGMPLAVKNVLPIDTSAYPTPAHRPHNSRLNAGKLHNVFGISLPHWQDGLKQAIREKNDASN